HKGCAPHRKGRETPVQRGEEGRAAALFLISSTRRKRYWRVTKDDKNFKKTNGKMIKKSF
ncbi:hypothetical protein, partial [Burkholderia mallei]|uniref:hypothetical protein n=1 Tax=Burkholderia mallei TaxID=13373 RepID=UPI001E310BB7